MTNVKLEAARTKNEVERERNKIQSEMDGKIHNKFLVKLISSGFFDNFHLELFNYFPPNVPQQSSPSASSLSDTDQKTHFSV